MAENEEFDIELGRSVRRHIERKVSPLRDRAMSAAAYGKPETDQIPVFVAENVVRAIESLAARDREREVGGVLLGSFYRNDEGSFVEVTDYIEAAAAPGTDVSLTFTHETWQQITAEQASRDSDMQIVGWYHTHPGLGVFMSREDEFIHSSFFTDPWHVAIVFDPIYHSWGCFKWHEGTLQRAGGFYVFGERKTAKRLRDYVRSISTARQPAPRSASAAADRREMGAAAVRLWIAIGILFVIQVVVTCLVLALWPRPPVKPNYYAKAVRLLSVSDLRGGEMLLRQALVENPGDRAAARELMRLNAATGDPAASPADSDRLDRVNSVLAAVDRAARQETDYPQPSAFSGIDLKGPGETEEKYSPNLAPADPARSAVKLYEEASSTWKVRLDRARAIQTALRSVSRKEADTETSKTWWNEAVTWLKPEPLRLIAYGLQADESRYKEAYKKLDKEDSRKVDNIRASLFRPQD